MVLLVHAFFMRTLPIVFFLYGLSFYSMGLAVFLEVRKGSKLRIVPVLPLLAGFAIIHGISEWFDGLPTITGEPNSLAINIARVTALFISVIFLIFFGSELIYRLKRNKWVRLLPLLFIALWLSLSAIFFTQSTTSFLLNGRILMFYLIYLPGSILAGIGFLIQYRRLIVEKYIDIAPNFIIVSFLFFAIAFFEGFISTKSFFLPSSVVNEFVFKQAIGIPVELIRAVLVFWIAFFVIRGMRIFEADSERRIFYLEEKRQLMDVLQESLLQFTMPQVEGLDIATHYESASTRAAIGGDYYDFFELSKNKYLFAVGDISGKGVEVAADAFRTNQAIRCVSQGKSEPKDILSGANNIIWKQTKAGLFATMTLFVYDKSINCLTYSSAGHPYPILCTPKESRFLTESHAALGNFPDEAYGQEELSFDNGSTLVLYTDGLVETKRDSQLFGDERLMKVVEKNRHLNAQQLVNKIIDKVTDFSRGIFTDDIVIMVVKKV